MRIRSPGSLLLGAVVWVFVVSSWAQGANGILTVTAGAPPTPPLPLVKHDDLWRYRKGTSAPPIGWQTNADARLDDSWLSGSGGFGYGDDDDTTVLTDMLNGYSTVYIRRSFEVTSQVETNCHLTLVIDFDDGFVAYLDGAEVARRNAPGAPGTEPSFEATAPAAHEASHGDVSPNPPLTLDLDAPGDRLQPGIHVLAILGLNAATNSSDFSLIADLMLVGSGSTASEGAFFTRIMTNTVTLSGTNTFTSSARVVVTRSEATFNPTDGTWSKIQTLAPGVNHLNVRALDGAGNVVASTNKDVVAELSSAFVGGTLAGNTIWSKAMGIIHVTNTVTVPVGSALTIDEDAILLLAPGASIQASNATISVNGRESNMVYFFPEDGTTVWGGLVSSGTNGALVVRHAEITAGHVEVLEGATGTVEDSFLHDYLASSPAIVHTLRAASFTERRCHVARYYEHLFQLTPVVIEDCLCEDITGDGIDFDGAPPGSAIRRCTIRHGDITNVDGLDLGSFADGTPTRGVIIEGCLIYAFSFDKGISIGEAAQNIP